MEKEKYYTPTIEEFHVGFEYEQKERFGDGTVKTKEDFDNANWIKKSMEIGELPYIERMLSGRNALNGICGVRVKYLDREDIESFGFIFKEISSKYGNTDEYSIGYGVKEVWIKIERGNYNKVKIMSTDGGFNIDGPNYSTKFDGIIKNKSEFANQLKRCKII